MLQIGTHSYTNVTVTTKAKDYIFILHSTGMTSIKVEDLPAEIRQQLGYADPSAANVKTNKTSGAWASQTLAKAKAKLTVPEVRNVEKEVLAKWAKQAPKIPLPQMTPKVIAIVIGVLLAIYLFHCFCLKLICEKTGNEPGFLVWVPILQLFPLLQAAEMSGWWFVAFFIPLLNVVASLVWCFKITQARGKSVLVAILLLLPGIGFLAFLYLAFSNGVSKQKNNGRIEIMAFETA